MKDTIVEHIAYGDGFIPVELPGHTRVITGRSELGSPVVDIRSAIKKAINNPIGHEPLTELVCPKSKVTIAFDDASGSYFQTRGIAILAHPLKAQFHNRPFRPFKEFYEKLLSHSKDPYWLWENHVEDFAQRP